MKVAVTFKTVTGDVIRDTTDDFPTLEAAREAMKGSLSRANDFIVLSMPKSATILNRAHVVSIALEAAQ